MDFFRGIEQFEINFEGEKGKIPVFYRSTYGMFGFFPAKSSKVKELLPARIKEKFKVPELIPGLTMCGIAGFMYKNSSLGPYNEVAITFPVKQKQKMKPNIFVLNLTDIIRGEFHVYVRHLPVTTKIAKEAGVIIYNYPKFIADIEFQNGSSFYFSGKQKRNTLFQNTKRPKIKV
jgi:Acetoacetate decarboxylase (ADC).